MTAIMDYLTDRTLVLHARRRCVGTIHDLRPALLERRAAAEVLIDLALLLELDPLVAIPGACCPLSL